jgi:nucleoside-diphosphate-sugar epimerase
VRRKRRGRGAGGTGLSADLAAMPTICLITGATGFVGGHLVEGCAARGWDVRALVRPSSDTGLLQRHNATLVRGDLADAAAIRDALQGVEVVFHCAGKVGDWGPIEEYRAVNVEALRGLLDACGDRPLRRFVHFSSLGVYAARHHHGTDESEPLPAHHIDGYTQTKVEAEQLVWAYHREHKIPVVVLRPGFIYGPRDRTLMPKLVDNLRQRKFRYISGGKRALNCIYVGNLVEAALIAADKPEAVGQVYNLTDGEFVSKRRFIESIVNGLGLPHPPPVSVPLWLARIMAWWMEGQARKKNSPKPPRLTQARLKLFGLNLDFSIEKAKRELGYHPRWSFDQGMAETVAWLKQNA